MRKKRHILYCVAILGYLLGIKNGYIALWEDGNADPIHIFPYRAALLPRADQARLEDGISIASQEKLMEMIEDYLS